MCSIDVSDTTRFNLGWLTINTSRDAFVNEAAIFVKLSGGVGDDHVFFKTGINIDDFVGNFTIFNDTIWSLNKAIFVNAGVGCEV